MNDLVTPSSRQSEPKWLRLLLKTALPGTILLASRLVYEQTVMTWRDGEQMIGFTLAHVFPFLYLWVILAHIALLSVAVAWFRGLQLSRKNWSLVLILCLFTGLLYIPYSAWMAATVRIAGPGDHGHNFLMIAAVDGRLALAKALVESGVSPNTSGGGSTALEMACRGGRINVAEYLLSQGAKIGNAPSCEGVLTGK